MKTSLVFATAGLALSLAACQPQEPLESPDVERFRAAIPSMEVLAAPAPEASTSANNIVGETALYPQAAYPIVIGVNGTVALTVTLMKAITNLPPTVFNSNTNEYVWGPFENQDGVGYIAVYVKDTGGAGDFRYEYGVLRGIGRDLATLSPVLLGGATPDNANEDHGFGVMVWDFEADRAFEQEHDPAFDAAAGNRGRFAAAYGLGPDENDPNNEMGIVVAVLRNFVGEDEPNEAPADLDYFYGHYVTPDNTIDFLDFAFDMEIDEPADGQLESVGLRMAFLDEGVGRAEADVVGGTLGPDARGDVVECWDTSLTETFINYQVSDGGTVTEMASEGELTDCGLFAATLDELNIPALEDLDADLMAALDNVAENGVDGL